MISLDFKFHFKFGVHDENGKKILIQLVVTILIYILYFQINLRKKKTNNPYKSRHNLNN